MGKSDLQSLFEFCKLLLFNSVLPCGFAVLSKSANFAGFPGGEANHRKPASERPPATAPADARGKNSVDFFPHPNELRSAEDYHLDLRSKILSYHFCTIRAPATARKIVK
jgi:hypothetical protein